MDVLLQQYERYHNHKETMAHTGLALQFAFVAAILNMELWPPEWVFQYKFINPYYLSGFMFFSIWFLFHIFMRWQLRKKRYAALFYAALMRTLLSWSKDQPKGKDLKPYNSNNLSSSSRLLVIMDCLITCYSASIKSDVGIKGFPTSFVVKYKEQIDDGTGSIKGEWILWVASVFMLILGVFRIFSY